VKRIIIMALGVLMGLALATPMALAGVGQGANAADTPEELAAVWTQWAFSKPVDVDSPLIGSYKGGPRCDGTPLSPTQGNTWFLSGTFDSSKAVRTCTMPAETQLFFPAVNWIAFPFAPKETPQNQREAAINAMNATLNDPKFSMRVTVDGTEVESNRIVRAISPAFFSVTMPEKNAFDQFVEVPGGVYEGWTTDGLWVTVPPLPKGEHTIHFEARARSVGVSQNNTYILTVG
jgi:hypothetical protein